MDRVNFFPGMEVLPSDQNNNTLISAGEYDRRFVQTIGYGVWDGLKVSAASTALHVNILNGLAIFKSGTRVLVRQDPTAPDTERSNITEPTRLNIPVADNQTNYILIKRRTLYTLPRQPHPDSLLITAGNTRAYESYEFIVRDGSGVTYSSPNVVYEDWYTNSPVAGAVYEDAEELQLATVVAASGEMTITDSRSWYAALSAEHMIYHNRTTGAQTADAAIAELFSTVTSIYAIAQNNNLQTYFDETHTDGIIGDTASTAYIININALIAGGSTDRVIVRNLTSSESVYVNGKRITKFNNVTDNVEIIFSQTTDASGTYTVAIQDTGTIAKLSGTVIAGVLPLVTVTWNATTGFLSLIKSYREDEFSVHTDLVEQIKNNSIRYISDLRIQPLDPPSKSVAVAAGLYYLDNAPVHVDAFTIDLTSVIAGLSAGKCRVAIAIDIQNAPSTLSSMSLPGINHICTYADLGVTNTRICALVGNSVGVNPNTYLDPIPIGYNTRFLIIGSIICTPATSLIMSYGDGTGRVVDVIEDQRTMTHQYISKMTTEVNYITGTAGANSYDGSTTYFPIPASWDLQMSRVALYRTVQLMVISGGGKMMETIDFTFDYGVYFPNYTSIVFSEARVAGEVVEMYLI